MTEGKGTLENVYDHTRIFLQPVAAASILGLLAFAGAMFVAGADYAGWIPGPQGYRFLGPFLAMFGLAQFLAAMWSYRARDGLSTAFHGTWGVFWMALGLVNVLNAFGVGGAVAGAQQSLPMLGYWYVVVTAISLVCALAALATNAAFLSTATITAASTGLMAIGMFAGSVATVDVGGYFFIIAAIAALYSGTAVLLEDTFGRAVLPVGEFKASRSQPEDIAFGVGEPGVLHGQWRAHHRRPVPVEGEKKVAEAGG